MARQQGRVYACVLSVELAVHILVGGNYTTSSAEIICTKGLFP